MNTWIKTTGFIAATALPFISLPFINTAKADELTALWQLENFDQPESVVVNQSEQAIYISNINGQPTELNGKGYISKLSIDGKVLDKHWLSDLNAPKGMAVYRDFLYIADMQRVHQVSISKAKIVHQFHVEQAKMLNDITIADDGTVYVSDLLAGGIYRISDNKISAWFNHEKLAHPNGLLWQQGELLIATWGLGMNSDFTTQTAGSIYSLTVNSVDTKNMSTKSMSTKNPELVTIQGAEQLGNLDGLVQRNNTLYVSDWISGELFKIENNNSSKVLTLKPGLADIGSAGDTIFTPSMFDGQVAAWKL